MNRVLLSAAILSATCLGAAAAHADLYPMRILPSEKCVMKRVPEVDVELCRKMISQGQTDCAKLGGKLSIEKDRMTCAAHATKSRDPIKVPKGGSPGPYNPAPPTSAIDKGDKGGCVLRPDVPCAPSSKGGPK